MVSFPQGSSALNGPWPASAPAPPDARFAEYRRSRDRRLRNELVEENKALAVHLARRFRNKGEPLEDLTQVAMLGLLKSVERFDPGVGTRFRAYATPTILGELRRHFRDKGWAVRVPRRVQELYLDIGRALRDLGQELGRPPTAAEVADRIGVDADEVLRAMEAGRAYKTTSLDALGATDEGGGGSDRVEALGVRDEALESVEDRLTVAALLDLLPEREQQIFRLRFEQELTQSQIADRVGISQMHVSRLLTAGIARLRSHLSAQTG